MEAARSCWRMISSSRYDGQDHTYRCRIGAYFLKLFPSLTPAGLSRIRAQEAYDIMGSQVSEKVPTDNGSSAELYESIYGYRDTLDQDNALFQSWEELYGPHEYHGDNFTSLTRFNLTSPFLAQSEGLTVSGYLDRSWVTEQYYAAEDMVMVSLALVGSLEVIIDVRLNQAL